MRQLNISRHTFKLVILILTLTGGIYVSYTYIISPLLLKKSHLADSSQVLDTQLIDTDSLESRLKELKKQVAEKEGKEQNKPQAPQYTALSYLDFVDYVGSLEKKSGVDIISIKEDGYLMAGQYFEIPYSIEVAGDYVGLLKFTNGLSETEGLLVWTSVNLGRGSNILTSDKNLLLSTDWATQIKDMLGSQYPNETVVLDSNKQNIEDSSITDEELTQTAPQELPKQVTPQDEGMLHLDLTFKFITVEDPSRAGVR